MSAHISREHLIPALSGGFAAGVVFWLSLGSDAGLFFVILPLLLTGLSLGARLMALSCLTACVVAMLLTGPAGGLSLAILIAFPSMYFIERSLQWRGNPAAREWYPMVRVFSEFAFALVCLFVLLALATQSEGGLAHLAGKMETGMLEPIVQGMANSKDADPDTLAAMHELGGDLSYVFLAGFAWLLLLLLYGLSVLANTVLKARKLALRPSLAVEMHGIPVSILVLLVTTALLAVLGDADGRFTARALFLVLLLPYFLAGMAWIHTFSIRRGIPVRKLWLACVYIVLVYTHWPILAVIAIGLYLQLSEILDRRSKIG